MIHVIPVNDSWYHYEDMSCPCNPTQQNFGVIVHNAFDGRDIEEARKEIMAQKKEGE